MQASLFNLLARPVTWSPRFFTERSSWISGLKLRLVFTTLVLAAGDVISAESALPWQPDVNALIAALVSGHEYHDPVEAWLAGLPEDDGLATCSITEWHG